MIRML